MCEEVWVWGMCETRLVGMVLLVYYDWLSRVGHGSQQQSRRGCLSSVCKCADWGGGVWTHVNDLGTECDTNLDHLHPQTLVRDSRQGTG